MSPKYFWCTAVVVVLGSAAGLLCIDHSLRHGGTPLLRCVAAATFAGLNVNPLTDGSLVCGDAEQCGIELVPAVEPVAAVGIQAAETENTPRRKTVIIQLYNASAPDIVTAISGILNSNDFVVVAEPVSNKLIVNASDDKLEEIRRVIAQLDVQPPQVHIDVLIAEVERADAKTGLSVLGVGLGEGQGEGEADAHCRTMSSSEFKAFVKELTSQGRLKVVASPQIVTTDNQAARVLVGQNFPYIAGTTTGQAQNGAVTSNIVAYRDVGVQLQVTPKISPDGTVCIRIIPEVSSARASDVKFAEGMFATVFNVQTIETTVLIKDGVTVAIGGLNSEDQKSELLMFVTPHVLRQDQRPAVGDR
jgi:general secretion pathway protein D